MACGSATGHITGLTTEAAGVFTKSTLGEVVSVCGTVASGFGRSSLTNNRKIRIQNRIRHRRSELLGSPLRQLTRRHMSRHLFGVNSVKDCCKSPSAPSRRQGPHVLPGWKQRSLRYGTSGRIPRGWGFPITSPPSCHSQTVARGTAGLHNSLVERYSTHPNSA